MSLHKTLRLLITSLFPATAFAGGVQTPEKSLESVTVEASRIDQIGVADSASQGTVTGKQLENRPLSRTAEMLEVVPGVIVTQHSGDGKANQYYVRGFNLDHGTDFRTSVMGMPVNMPTHAHGQGYADLNFVIPELVKSIQYKKGTYFAEEGDFSAAGAAAFDYVRSMPHGIASVEVGENRYRRALLANSSDAGPGTLLYAIEAAGQDGPWELPENFKRFNGVLSYSAKVGADDFRVTGMALKSSWTSTDQIPQRAINAGALGRYGFIDPTDGGDTSRYSLSGDWLRRYQDGALKVNAYLIRSRLDLFSNFTYSLDDPVNDDQFNQREQRTVAGLNLDRSWVHQLGGFESETTAGLQLRHDRLSPVGLYSTVARQRVSTTREDRVKESATGVFVSNTTRWTEWFRTIAGLRADHYSFDVNSDTPANSGKANDTITSPKLSAIFSPAKDAEVYLNWGRGFHSNDARGIVQTVDPKTGLTTDSDGNPVSRATPLAKAIGKEIGLRLTGLAPGLQTSLSLWQLDLASELLFIGDAGTTEASRPSRRTGIEIANYYTPAPGWIIDADFAFSRSRFRDDDPAGPYIPGSIERTASVGITGEQGKWSGGLRLRYFGSRPLIEDNSVRSGSSTLVNAKLGYAIAKDVKLTVEILNLLNRKVSDVDYFYASRLRGEAAAVSDIHTHPAEPRTVRMGMVVNF
jgi:outer membrane receptor protein involved in Fe transport